MARRAGRESLFMGRSLDERRCGGLAGGLPLASFDSSVDGSRPGVRLFAVPAPAGPAPVPALEVGAVARAAARGLRLAAVAPRRRPGAAPARRGLRPPAVRPEGAAARRARGPRRPAPRQLRARGD